jgi:dTDP-4-dehydrorhamnose 3,5-epimerase-like enzyme
MLLDLEKKMMIGFFARTFAKKMSLKIMVCRSPYSIQICPLVNGKGTLRGLHIKYTKLEEANHSVRKERLMLLLT